MGSIPSKQENDYIDEIAKKYYYNNDKNDTKNNNETKSNKSILKKKNLKHDKIFFIHDFI